MAVHSVYSVSPHTPSEVKRTMITKYENSMGLAQSQLTNIEVCISTAAVGDILLSGNVISDPNATWDMLSDVSQVLVCMKSTQQPVQL